MNRRHFNIAGPCRSDLHYMLPPERRLVGVEEIIAQQGYFVLHAPRQIGKTTALVALARRLTEQGQLTCVLVSAETGAAFAAIGPAERAILGEWRQSIESQLPRELWPPAWADGADGTRIGGALKSWSEFSSRPLVLFIDEIDALRDEVLESVLRQLRAGHRHRPAHFPASLALVGLRDVRDYKATPTQDGRLGTSSPFNIKVASLTMRDFSRDEVAELYAQHTADTGQPFDDAAVDRAHTLTGGQPWLVNALAREVVATVAAPQAITPAAIDRARDVLIARQDTHLDSLAERLREPRVQAVIEPILAGEALPPLLPDDVRFALDLGLVRRASEGGLVIANPIYAEVIPRVLTSGPRDSLPATAPVWRRDDGSLDPALLMEAFLGFWRQHGQPLLGSAPYHEVAPHLVFLAFLDRVANGGGAISREYAIGSGRLDVLLEYGPAQRRELFAFELKVHRDGRPDPTEAGLAQLDRYLAGLGLTTGWLIIFDRRMGLPPLEERVRADASITPGGRRVQVIRG